MQSFVCFRLLNWTLMFILVMYTWVITIDLVVKIWTRQGVAIRRLSALIKIAKKLEQHSVTYTDSKRIQ
jgi:hypothetical protein